MYQHVIGTQDIHIGKTDDYKQKADSTLQKQNNTKQYYYSLNNKEATDVE